MTRASEIYDAAVRRAMDDHKEMVRKFLANEIHIASPCGLERERQYIIEAFDAAFSAKGES